MAPRDFILFVLCAAFMLAECSYTSGSRSEMLPTEASKGIPNDPVEIKRTGSGGKGGGSKGGSSGSSSGGSSSGSGGSHSGGSYGGGSYGGGSYGSPSSSNGGSSKVSQPSFPVSSAKPATGSSSTTVAKTSSSPVVTGSAFSPSSPSGLTARTGTVTKPRISSYVSSYTASSFSPKTPSWQASPRLRIIGAALITYYLVSTTTSSWRVCGENTYRFGSGCRVCSQSACPIGQYRIDCDAYTNSYCTPCTNKPENAYYTSPGNNNDCAYNMCTPQAPCGVCKSATESSPACIGGSSWGDVVTVAFW
jgi:hypothetical protein